MATEVIGRSHQISLWHSAHCATGHCNDCARRINASHRASVAAAVALVPAVDHWESKTPRGMDRIGYWPAPTCGEHVEKSIPHGGIIYLKERRTNGHRMIRSVR